MTTITILSLFLLLFLAIVEFVGAYVYRKAVLYFFSGFNVGLVFLMLVDWMFS